MEFFFKLKLNYLSKMHGYPQFSFWIPRVLTKARFKRRTFYVPNLMQMSENNRFFSFALDSVHEKFDVWNRPKIYFFRIVLNRAKISLYW